MFTSALRAGQYLVVQIKCIVGALNLLGSQIATALAAARRGWWFNKDTHGDYLIHYRGRLEPAAPYRARPGRWAIFDVAVRPLTRAYLIDHGFGESATGARRQGKVLLRSYAKRTKKADTSAAGRHRSCLRCLLKLAPSHVRPQAQKAAKVPVKQSGGATHPLRRRRKEQALTSATCDSNGVGTLILKRASNRQSPPGVSRRAQCAEAWGENPGLQ